MTKQKSVKEDLLVDYYLQLKYCSRHCILLPLTRAKSLARFNTKMEDLKRVLDLKGGLNNLIFSIGFQMLKI